MSTKNLPAFTSRIGALTVTVWANTTNDTTWYSTTFTRAFRDTNGDWADTTTFNHADLANIATLATAAEAFIRNQK